MKQIPIQCEFLFVFLNAKGFEEKTTLKNVKKCCFFI